MKPSSLIGGLYGSLFFSTISYMDSKSISILGDMEILPPGKMYR
jgi:hypothetical protein